MKQSGTAQRARSGRWPAWLVVQSGGAIAPWRNAPFALFIAGILAYGAAFAWYTLDRFDLVNLIRDGYRDDAFYYFQIAYHMAEGRFSTFDGGITRTNGYHPLWLFLITPFYWVFDKTDALFVVKAFEIMLLAGGVALAAVAARVARLPWFLLFAALPALYAQRGMLFGMEAAAGLFTLGLLFLATCLFGRDSDRWRWPLAAVVFALPWVRLECAAVAVAVAAALCLFEWSGRFCRASASPKASASAGGAGRSFLRLQAALPFAAAFAGVLVYFAYNGVVFGGVVPVSGAVKVLWAQGLWREEGGYSLAESIDVFTRLEAFDGELLTALEVCVWALLVWRLARGARSREDALLLAFAAGVFGLAAGHLAKFAHSVLSMHPDLLLQYEWYFVPAYLMEALVVLLRCCVGIYLLRRLLRPEAAAHGRCSALRGGRRCWRRPSRQSRLRRAVPGGRQGERFAGGIGCSRVHGCSGHGPPAAGGHAGGVLGWRGHRLLLAPAGSELGWIGQLLRVQGGAGRGGGRRVFAAARHLPLRQCVRRRRGHMGEDGSRLGRAGLLRAVRSVPSRNDRFPLGLRPARRRRPSRLRKGAMHGRRRRSPLFPAHYDVARARTGQIVDVEVLFKAARGSRLRFGGLQFKLYRHGSGSKSSPIDRAAWLREKMAPHLEPQADGIGLLVEGRTAQAFAWDCTADANEVAEWAFGGKVEAVTDWTQTADGVCASALVLPHERPGPVRMRRAALAEAASGLSGGGAPAIRADSTPAADATHPAGFDVYLAEDTLVYAKAACERADVETPFFLHVVPAGDDFDDGRESVGFNNLDFMLAQHGDWLGEEGETASCLAEVPLPRYGIAEIRTGQYSALDFRPIRGGSIASRGRPRTEGA